MEMILKKRINIRNIEIKVKRIIGGMKEERNIKKIEEKIRRKFKIGKKEVENEKNEDIVKD